MSDLVEHLSARPRELDWNSGGQYARYFEVMDDVTLDGSFTREEVKALGEWMEWRKEKPHGKKA